MTLDNVVEIKSFFSQFMSQMNVTILLGEKGPACTGYVCVILVYILYK